MNTELSREESVTCSLKYTTRIKKGKEVIRVFPDYGGTGLYSGICPVSLEDLGIQDEILGHILHRWRDAWESEICNNRLSASAINVWYDVGLYLVQYLNRHYGDKYLFINQIDEVQPRVSTNDLH